MTTNETNIRLRIHLKDGDWDAYRRLDEGHTANSEISTIYLAHMPAKGYLKRHGDYRHIEIDPDDAKELNTAMLPVQFLADNPDPRLPYAEAVRLIARYQRDERERRANLTRPLATH